MKRRISNLVAGIVAVLLIVSLLGLAVSYLGSHHIRVEGRGREADLSYDMGPEIWCGDGRILIESRNSNDRWEIDFVVPTAICALYLFLWSGIPGKWHLEIKPKRPGLCKKCGYDLRASPERCPECGTAKRI